MKSPALNGLNTRIIRPPAKFCIVPLRAIPIARPPPVRRAAIDDVSIPTVPIVMMTSMIVRTILVMLCTNEAMPASVFFLSNDH